MSAPIATSVLQTTAASKWPERPLSADQRQLESQISSLRYSIARNTYALAAGQVILQRFRCAL